jgi:hypothetical protein
MEDTKRLAPYQRWANDAGVALLFITHCRKRQGDHGDPLDDVMGSTGNTGTADNVLVLQRERAKTQSKLIIMCKENDTDRELDLIYDKRTGCMTQTNSAEGESGKKARTLWILGLLENKKLTGTDIATHLQEPHGTVKHWLKELKADGVIEADKSGYFITEKGRLYLTTEE